MRTSPAARWSWRSSARNGRAFATATTGTVGPNDYVVRELATAIAASGERHSAAGRRREDAVTGGAATIAAGTLPPQRHRDVRQPLCRGRGTALQGDCGRARPASRTMTSYRQRVEYGRFFSDAELTQARTTVSSRGLDQLCADRWLYVLSSQFWMSAARVSSSPESFPGLKCDDPALKTAEQRAACVAMNTTVTSARASYVETLDRVVAASRRRRLRRSFWW